MRRLADDDPRAMGSDEAAAVIAHERHVASVLAPLKRLFDAVAVGRMGLLLDEEVRTATKALSEAYSALVAAGDLKGYSGTQEPRGSVEAFARWGCRMEEWFRMRDGLAHIVAARAGFPIPCPEDEDGRVYIGALPAGRIEFRVGHDE